MDAISRRDAPARRDAHPRRGAHPRCDGDRPRHHGRGARGHERRLVAKGTGSKPAGSDTAATYSKRIGEQEKRLKELRAEIQSMRSRDRDLGKKEKDHVAQLRALEREAATTADLLRTLQAKQGRVEGQLEGIRAEHDRASEVLAERKQQLSGTLRAMYVRGTPTTAEVVLRATTLRYALSHFKYMELLARNNERLYATSRSRISISPRWMRS
jgi:septal ring factor EnvC (AmiA/AmiB activator)